MYRFLLLSYFFLLAPYVLSATELKIQQIAFPEEMVTNKVNAVMSTSDGMIWIGSASGLSRYDGYEFVSWQSSTDDEQSLLSNYVMDITEDPRQRLWIRTDMGFSCYDMVKEKFYGDVTKLFRSWGIPDYPDRIVKDQDDNLWIYVYGDNAALYMLRAQDDKARLVANKISAIGSHNISDIDVYDNYLVLVNRLGTVILVDRERLSICGVFENISQSQNQESEFSIFADKEGLLWVWSTSGLWIFDISTSSFLPKSAIPASLDGMIDAITQDCDGLIWVSQNHRGVTIYEKNPYLRTLELSNCKIPELTSQKVTCFYQGQDNTMWMGTYKHGIYNYNKSIIKFDHHDMADVNVVCPDGRDMAWIGTDSRGLWRWNIWQRKVEKIPDNVGIGEHCAIVAIENDGKGGCYVGTYGNGLLHYSNGRWSCLGTADGLAIEHVWALLRDGDKGLWIGTLGAGLQYLDFSTREFTLYDSSNSNLGNNYISSFARDNNGRIYISTDDGICILYPKTRNIEYLKGDKFSNGHINQLIVDSRGLVWIATRSGLDVYNPKEKAIREIDLGLSMPPNTLGIVEDADHNIWASVGSLLCNVIVRDMKAQDYSVQIFNYYDGLTPGDFNQRSLALIGSDIIAAGSLYGLSYASPRYIHYNNYDGKVRFTAISINGTKILPGNKIGSHTIIESSMLSNPKVNIYNVDENPFTLYFATDNYVIPNKTQFLYRFDNKNSDWTPCPAGVNYITFAKLLPGNYHLQVKAINSDGLPSSSLAEIEIEVHPPFWASYTAMFIYVLLLIALVLFIIWLIKKREKRRFLKAQYEQELERQQHLNQMKLKFFTNISHELRTPLTLIITPLEDMIRLNNDPNSKGRLDIMYRNAQHLLSLVNQILDLRKSELSELHLNQTAGDIIEISTDIIQKMKPLADSKNIHLAFVKEEDKIISMIDIDKTNKIISNLLSNAIKFTPYGGNVQLDVRLVDNNIVIKVIDTGIGIADTDKAHIFERFYQAEQIADNSISGTGIGLNMVWEYVKTCNGNVSVADNPSGVGTVFTVTLPLIECIHNADNIKSVRNDAQSTVLIVDDNPDIITLISENLNSDYNVVTAANGEEALAKLNQTQVDLIISDIMMPVMNGIDLCRKVKSNPATAAIPMILLSAKNDISSKLEGLTLGADDYLTKPFNSEELKLRIQKMLHLSKEGMKRTFLEPSPSDIVITSLDEKLIEKAVKYVEDNIERTDLSVEELSSALGMSRTQLYKKLVNITGKTPLEFIRVLRLKRAAQMLRESQMNISEIAFATGFGTPKYFSKYFKEEFGILPSQYQKNYKSTPE